MNIGLVEQVANRLGREAVSGTPIRSEAELALAVGNRLPLSALKGLATSGISETEIDAFVIPHRTRRHRAEKGQPLTVEESDRTVRLLRVHAVAEQVFGDQAKGHRWLRRSLNELEGKTPLELSQTEAGARVVETILGKIAWGAAA